MIGQTISHYKIIEELGAGGMGVVYKAEDTKLKRTVALKFLPSGLTRDKNAKTRFVREARAASALQHDNICAIHEIDETPDGRVFISMDCYDGETLKDKIAVGPLPVDDTLDITIQVARGLSKAHEAGMVHRDVKPANVMVTKDGAAKILDFGLAKLAGQTKLTKTGMTVGTVAYMSPEQARGDETDSRSDIWSLGVMLYEMLAGRLPFRGEVEPAMLYSIMHEDPEPVTMTRGDVPIGVEDIIEKALTKERSKRYETMEDLLTDLETQQDQIALGIKDRRFRALRRLKRRKRLVVATATAVVVVAAAVLVKVFHTRSMAIDSVAVLPFANLSGDEDQEYFSDGMTVALINELGQIGELTVISRTSVMRYKETDKPLPEIARELNVDAIVEASVLRSGDQVRITAQLIRANPEHQIWAESYERDARDVLSLHGEVARAIAGEIQVTLTPREQARLARVRTVNPEAYDLYLKGEHQVDKFTKGAIEKAVEYFQKAIEIDPNYAQAYAGLANCYVYFGWSGDLPLKEASSRAAAFTKKALEIDDTLSESHFALANTRFYMDWEWVGAETEFKRAIELNPGYGEAHGEYAWLLMATGRSEEAIAEAKHFLRLDPVAYLTNMTMTWMYYCARQYDQAIAQSRQMAELEPKDPRPYYDLRVVYEQMGRYEDAIEARRQSMTFLGTPPEEVATKIAALDSAYGESGPKGYWMWQLESLKGRYDRYPGFIAMYYAQLGDKDQAFAWLEKGFEKRDSGMFRLKVEPCWDPLRDDPRFQDFLRRMNFPKNEAQG